MRNKFLICVGALIVTLVFGAGAQAVKFQETQITNDSADQWYPKIYSPYAVWLDWRNDADANWVAGGGKDGINKRDVYLRDLDSGIETKLSGADSIATHVEITNSHVFWLNASATEPGLHCYRLFDKKFIYAVPIGSFPGYSDYGGTYLAAWTDKVAFTTAGEAGIFIYNEAAGTKTKISDAMVNGLDYEDDVIVYTDTNIYGGKVYKKTISSGSVIELSNDSTKAASFSDNISMRGNKVVWQTGGKKPNMVFYNLQTSQSELLTSGEKNRTYPRVGALKAVWTTYDDSLGKSVLTIYDFNTKETAIHGTESVSWADVSGGKVIFSSSRNGKTDIYLIDPDQVVIEAPVAAPAAEPLAQAAKPVPPEGVKSGDLIKASSKAVYYYGADGKRYVFPNEKCYFTWYNDFSTVKTISNDELAQVEIGGNVTYRPGVKMIKAETSNKVYAVDKGGVRRWISAEAVAVSLYGADWNTKKIDDIPDAFLINYKEGAAVSSFIDYNPASVTAASSTINIDKGLK